jgi:hypothetical protein
MSMEQGHRAGWPQRRRKRPATAPVRALDCRQPRLGDVLQLPLYTVWTTGTGTRKQQAFAVVQCRLAMP